MNKENISEKIKVEILLKEVDNLMSLYIKLGKSLPVIEGYIIEMRKHKFSLKTDRLEKVFNEFEYMSKKVELPKIVVFALSISAISIVLLFTYVLVSLQLF